MTRNLVLTNENLTLANLTNQVCSEVFLIGSKDERITLSNLVITEGTIIKDYLDLVVENCIIRGTASIRNCTNVSIRNSIIELNKNSFFSDNYELEFENCFITINLNEPTEDIKSVYFNNTLETVFNNCVLKFLTPTDNITVGEKSSIIIIDSQLTTDENKREKIKVFRNFDYDYFIMIKNSSIYPLLEIGVRKYIIT